MTSILEVEQLDTLSSNASSTLTIGGTNTTTIAFGPNVTTTPSSLANAPAFEAYSNASQIINDATWTKISFNTERFDSNGYYDSSTNYRFTPLTAGKYYIYGYAHLDSSGASTLAQSLLAIYKNGTTYQMSGASYFNNYSSRGLQFIASTIDFNGSSDYVELWAQIDTSDGSTGEIVNQSGNPKFSVFGGYRLIGA